MSATPLGPGSEIAPGYEVIAHLRRRGPFDVYDAWSHERGARCWIKSVADHGKGAMHRLLAEGRLLERLSHPHIIRAYETLESPRPLVVTERLAGQTLDRLIETSDEPLGSREVAYLGLHLGAALRYLHEHGVLHLELAPASVVAEARRAKLADLGAARPPGPIEPAGVSQSRAAPELRSDGVASPAADVWALGALLSRAAGGEDGAVQRSLSELAASCLEGDPSARPTMRDLLARLEPLAVESPAERRFVRFETPDSGPAGLRPA